MADSIALLVNEIESRIFTIRGMQVMLDMDLAILYDVEVKRLKEQVRRNKDRFPDEFCFQLTETEYEGLVLRSQIATSKGRGGRRYMPYAFTEQGVAMLSAVLHSEIAIKVSIQVMKAFIKLRKMLISYTGFIQRMESVEKKQIETDKKIDKIFDALESKELVPKCGIFFEGEVFDAYVLASDIIKSAKQSIILIDNYIDESVLTMLSKKSENIKITLLTRDISEQLKLDIDRFNQQYPLLEAKIFNVSHDRFLIIDNKTIFHLGASLKDLGKKWFAFTKMDLGGLSLLDKLQDYMKENMT
ncbi:MAG: ORF6N domain-containing protein [Candidatus Cloacimonetes bacterium]|nr:ORF6N domain-containing protein [Candidatus Cloacimonadota bacterium]